MEELDLGSKRLSIFNIALENDEFIPNLSSSPLHLIPLQLPESWKESVSLGLFKTGNGQEEDDDFPEVCNSIEPERIKWKANSKFRESIAWDSAFFTDAGVLDPEELSSMITGTGKSEKHVLFGINEDVEQSGDSFSTLESDDLILEQLEAEIFEDIRASIYRSCNVPNVMISSTEKASPKALDDACSASKEAGSTSKNTMLSKIAPKRTIRAQTSGTSKSQQKHIDRMQGSGKAVTAENSKVTQLRLLARLTKPSTKPNSVSAAIAKGTSIVADHVKVDHVDAKLSTGTKEARASKAIASNNAKVLPKPVSSSKPSSNGSSARVATRSSSESSASSSSEKTGKSTFPAARREVDSRSVGRNSSTLFTKTPSKIASKNDISFRNSAVGSYVMSSKMSPCVSPASSISEWSSTSSSSSCSVNKRSNGSRSRSVDYDSPTLGLTNCSSNCQSSDKSGPKTALLNESTSKPSRCHDKLSQTASVKPSGLRVPSKKIGFFEGVKSVSGSMQSHSNGKVGVRKSGVDVRTNTETKTAKLSGAAKAVCDTEKTPSHVKDKFRHEMKGDSNLYAKDVVVEGLEITKHVADDGMVPVEHEDEMTKDMNLQHELNDIIAVEGESCDSVSNTEIVRSELADSTLC